ncbi:hypothetical protein [Silvibacterium acidisoli]|uniref:hypothetical protein n=1 Tax=Acidobacteriaceae bacterium ZG23-2 TaxID=2883246 RepID=UPI00406C10C7
MSIPTSVGQLAVRKIAEVIEATGVASVARTDTTEYTPERLPAINVFRQKDQFTRRGVAFDAAEATFHVTVRAMVKATSESDEAVDPLLVSAWQAIMADESLGSLVTDTEITGVEYTYVPKGEWDMLAADLTVAVTVQVGRTDPSQNKIYLS